MPRKETAKKKKIRQRLENLGDVLDDMCDELDRSNTNFDYMLDFCDEMKEILYRIKGSCINNYINDDKSLF